MEAYESFVALAMETEGLVVSEAVKFPVTRPTGKKAYSETQTHGFEVDLVGARRDRLVLATVKSFFGSAGVQCKEVMGTSASERGNRLYALLNDPEVQTQVLHGATTTYGYTLDEVDVRLYVGKFAAPIRKTHEPAIREWCSKQIVGGGPIKVIDAAEVAITARSVAASKMYRDNPALVAMKVLAQAGMLPPLPEEED
jgi:hypothetical protein